jgi:hypothetical protein
LTVPKHELLEKTAGVNLANIIEFCLFFGKANIHKMFLEVSDEFQIELALIAIQIDQDHFGTIIGALKILHHWNRFNIDLGPVIVFVLL